MLRTFFSKFVYIIIGLALVGLIAQLFTNTSGFLKSIFLTIGIAAALSLVVYFLFLKTRKPGNEMKKYRKAVKQSARKYKTKTPEIKKSHSLIG
ncbi:SA1362 family protein [Virgibacillus sp. 179-BFC.A HS]|uniref:SA1362 family protein n=1 Tax=Tigheibacillus jepli TaxID=3035914 RepID=A0ABU5CH14_9BACI|nr:SA1362 family protein [Virgibacillus sp. 179-BFC.A HS]MDY0405600.1 SA1362 family protein [Virgibacillus sp. 179-BFC.A HS]